MVRKQHLEDSPKSTLAHQLCTWWCSKCVSTILEVMENAILQCRLKRGVSVGTPQTSYSSCDVMYIEQNVWNKPCFQWWLQCPKKRIPRSLPLQNLNFGNISLDVSQRAEEFGKHFNVRCKRKMCMRDVCAGGCYLNFQSILLKHRDT